MTYIAKSSVFRSYECNHRFPLPLYRTRQKNDDFSNGNTDGALSMLVPLFIARRCIRKWSVSSQGVLFAIYKIKKEQRFLYVDFYNLILVLSIPPPRLSMVRLQPIFCGPMG